MLSILIPAYNAERFVTAAVRSAARQTTRMPVEIIVCDDGSTDNTVAKLQDLQSELPNLRLLQHAENKGVSIARNTLMAHLNPATQFVAFFDADDIYVDAALDRALDQFALHPTANYTWGRTQVVPSSALEKGGIVGDEWPILHAISLSPSVIRSDFLATIGQFNVELDFGEDFDFLLRMAEATPHRVVHDDVILYYRRHGSNATNDSARTRRGSMRAMLLHAKRKAANPNLHDVSGILPISDPEATFRAINVTDEH